MGLVQSKQPTLRFDLAGPYGFQGVSFEPKVVTFQKDAISGTSNNDFWAAPAGTFIAQAVIFADAALDGSGTVELGTDGNPDALIDQTDFDASTTDNWATNIGSTTAAGANGLYLPDGDIIRLAVGGTPTVGAVSGLIIYFEKVAMLAQGIHFDID
jgi:hypothetical protein